VNKHGTCFYWQ